MATARRFARETLTQWHASELADSVVLLVSELVTNAVIHAGTAARLELRLDTSSLRVEVEDLHPARVLPIGTDWPADDDERGRGLLITASLASTWGVEYSSSTKRVWLSFERQQQALRVAAEVAEGDAFGTDARVAVIALSEAGVVISWNGDAQDMFGWTSEDVIGRGFGELLNPDADEHIPHDPASPEIANGWQGTYVVLRKNGPSVRTFASHLPQASGGGSVALLVPWVQRALLERPPAPTEAPPEPTELNVLGLHRDALAKIGLDGFLALAVERARDTLAADASYLLTARLAEDEFEVRAVSGLPDSLRGTRLHAQSTGVPNGLTPQLPVLVSGLNPDDIPLLAGTQLRSLIVVPAVVEGRVVGALAVASENAHGFSDDQAALLQRFADTVSVATDQARLQSSERERSGWLNFLLEAGDLLAGSLDQDMTMAITGQIVVPQLADWCAVYLDDSRGKPILQQVWHADEGLVDGLRAALTDAPPEEAERSDQPVLLGAVISIPLAARGRRLGTLTLGRTDGEPLRGEMVLVAESVARKAALAIDNSRAHSELSATSTALQRSLLPALMPNPPGMDVGVVYEAAGEETTAGGDFYDLFALGGGRWCFAIGDVCGTGAEAAAVTGLARHSIRALAQAGLSPAAVLERLNAAIIDEGDRARFLTLACGVLRPGAGGIHLGLVCAGHPPPFLVRDGSVEQVGRPQSLLGVLDRVAYVVEDHRLERDDLLVAVTDGVLERREGGRMLGEDGLAAELRGTGLLPAQAVAERIRSLVVDFTDSPPRDDMAVMAIRVGPPA